MTLVVDIGNSRMKWTLIAGGPWKPARSVPIYRKDLKQVADEHWAVIPAPTRALVSNVGGSDKGETLRTWMQQQWNIEPGFFKSAEQSKGITNCYEQPEQLGADRWAAILGARSQCNNGSLCVVDCGTAVTIDGLTADNRFLGGVIFPGIDLVQDSLLARTSDILENRAEFRGVFGTTTAECVSGGSYVGLAGGISRVLAEMHMVLDQPRVFITGGDARSLLPLLDYPLQYEPDLVLRGLAYTLG